MKSIISLYVDESLISPIEPVITSSLLLSESSNVLVLPSVVLILSDISLIPRSICVIPLMLFPELLMLEARLLTAFFIDDSRRLTFVLIVVFITTWLFCISERH